MNILAILFLSVAANPALTCARTSADAADFQLVAATQQSPESASVLDGVGPVSSDTLLHASTIADVQAEDLGFYFSAHSQVVHGAPSSTLTPWLELRPIGDVMQRTFSETTEPVLGPAEAANNDCSWSLDGAAVLGPPWVASAA